MQAVHEILELAEVLATQDTHPVRDEHGITSLGTGTMITGVTATGVQVPKELRMNPSQHKMQATLFRTKS